MPFILITILFFFVFFQGALSEYVFHVSYAFGHGKTDSMIMRFLVECAVAANFGLLVIRKPIRLPAGSLWFLLYVGWAVLSATVEHHAAWDGFMYARYTLYAFLVYVLAANQEFKRYELSWLFNVVALFMLLQIVVSSLNLFVYGQTEWRVGTISITTGEMGTVFTLVGLGFATGQYFYARRSWLVLLVGMAFMIVGFASGKRAIYFLLPIFVASNTLLYFVLQRRKKRSQIAQRYAFHLVLCLVLVAPAMFWCVQHTGGIAEVENGGLMAQLHHAFQYADDYESGLRRNGDASGRLSANLRVVESLTAEKPNTVLFGFGPAALLPRSALAAPTNGGFSPLGIYYGIVGWSRDTLSIGLPGVIFFVLGWTSALNAVYRVMRRFPLSPRWRGVGFGTISGILVLLFSYFQYASVFMYSGMIGFLLLFCAGLLTSRICAPQLVQAREASGTGGSHFVRSHPGGYASRGNSMPAFPASTSAGPR